jgi:uncharacterized membrane protein YfcA
MQRADRQHSGGHLTSGKDVAQVSAIGSTAGAFSALFGVGGGTVLVPLLAFWRGLSTKQAAGTSLLAIAVIASFASVSYAIFGHVHLAKGILIGLPAIAGVLFGTWLQHRLPERVLSGMFACLMVVVIVLYLTR